MSLQGQHSFPQRRTYRPGFVTEAWGFHPGLKGEVMYTRVSRDEYERAMSILFRLATERERPLWAFWRARFPYSHEPLRNDAANLLRQVGYNEPMISGCGLVGDVK